MTKNGTSTQVGHHTTVTSMLRPGCHPKGWVSRMMCLWDDWSIQLLVLLSLISHIVLAVLGSRRKISRAETIKFFTWASYLLSSYFATLALSKLTTISLYKSEEEYDTELKALLAPFILLMLGSPDSITAYSVEDNRLGMRRVLSLVIAFCFMVWILGRSWKTSIEMTLYFPMFVAGIIKYGETIWALYSVYDQNKNVIPRDFDVIKLINLALTQLPENVPGLEILLKAYCRFDCLKPHLADWLKHPLFMSDPSMSIDEYSAEDVFLITDMELGFMYDVLYTKAPVLYTKCGITLRVIGYFSLLLTLGGFMGLFFEKHLRDPYVIYTFGLLTAAVLLETFQLLKLFCSDWVIIKNIGHLKNSMALKFLKVFVKRSLKKKRWCNTIQQFNFLDFCHSEKQPWHFKMLKRFRKVEKFERYWLTKSVQIPTYVKQLLLQDMTEFERKREHKRFTKRGEWTLNIHESLDKLKWSIEKTFDKSIIIWHIATNICNKPCPRGSNRKEASKLISDYMMFLLVRHPHILSMTTAEITFHHAYKKLETFFLKEHLNKENILNVLQRLKSVQGSDPPKTVITKGWKVLEEAQKLARDLESTKDTWELISSVWFEMLCFAAYNCRQYHHTKLLRQGGQIITHVWLLLSHKTDKFRTMKLMDQNIEME